MILPTEEIQIIHTPSNRANHEGMYYVPQRANAGMDPWTTPQIYDNIGEFFDLAYDLEQFIKCRTSIG